MNFEIRTCELSDLDSLVRISRQTFIDAFESDNNPQDFKSYIDEAFSKTELLKELKDRNSRFYLVYHDTSLIAYFKLCEFDAQSEAFGNEAFEISRIYVVQDFQGQALGSHLLEFIKKVAKRKGKTMLWLGVWQKNIKAVRFYERHGFKIFDSHSFFIGKDQQTDWLMRLYLV